MIFNTTIQLLKMRKETFKGKIAIVTGASSGIGKALATQLAREGARVMLAARREEKLKSISESLQEEGCTVAYCTTDVTKEEECRRLIEETVNLWNGIDIMICNAGISMRANFDDLDLQVIHRLMDVNFFGTVNCTKYALPYLQKSHGSLLGISSTAGIHGLPWRTGYSASKFAISGFLETVRVENLKKNVHVMIAFPGFTTSDIRLHALTADGTQQGNTPRDESKMASSEETAAHILKGLRKRKLCQLNFVDILIGIFKIISPHFLDKMMYKYMAMEPDSPTKE